MNDYDDHAVSVVKAETIVGCVPREMSCTFWHFIMHGGSVDCKKWEGGCSERGGGGGGGGRINDGGALTVLYGTIIADMRCQFEGGVYFSHRDSTVAAPRPQHYVNLVLGLALTPACMMADLELIQFSFSSAIRGHHVYKSTWQTST